MDRFTRPSCLGILNTWTFREELVENPIPPEDLMDSPERALHHFFSLLREVKSHDWQHFIPFIRGFFSSSLIRKFTIEEMEKLLQQISRIHLIKTIRLAKERNGFIGPRFFIELEVLGDPVDDRKASQFCYYYGFVEFIQEQSTYKILAIDLKGEQFQLRYDHEWDVQGESYVDIYYGCRCNIVKTRQPTRQDQFVKNIFVNGNDGKDYLFRFVELTNGVDFEIQSLQKDTSGQWVPIKIKAPSPTFKSTYTS